MLLEMVPLELIKSLRPAYLVLVLERILLEEVLGYLELWLNLSIAIFLISCLVHWHGFLLHIPYNHLLLFLLLKFLNLKIYNLVALYMIVPKRGGAAAMARVGSVSVLCDLLL